MTDQQVIEYNVNEAQLTELAKECEGLDPAKSALDYAETKAALSKLTKCRTGLEAERKLQKAAALEHGKKVDSAAAEWKAKILKIETPLREKKEAVDKEAEQKEQARVDGIKQRLDRISDAGLNLTDLTMPELERRLAKLQQLVVDDSFEEFEADARQYRSTSINLVEGSIASLKLKEEERRKLEEQRKQQEEEQAKLKKQNAEIQAAAEKLKQEQDKLAADKAEIEKAQREEEERKERARQEEELRKAKEEEERKAAERAEALKPDAEKLAAFAKRLEEVPEPEGLNTPEAEQLVTNTRTALSGIANRLRAVLGE